MIGYIYKITNPNGRIYIGQTKNFTKRKYYYKSNKSGQPLIQRILWNEFNRWRWWYVWL
jgi:predicted GIY-YIG superfamily endonuclease